MKNNIYSWQGDLWQRLVSTKSRLPNALLLHGKAGIGKVHFGIALAQALLCEAPLESGDPCGKCISCGWFEADGHPDFRMIVPDAEAEASEAAEGAETARKKDKKASKYITVEQIRELSGFINLTTHRHGLRIVLIHPAEAMNAQAANALLKTLEEPPPGTLFILVSHQSQRLLPTVRSRCQKINAPLPDREGAAAWLREQGVAEAGSLLAQAGDAPLAALQLNEEGYQARRVQVFDQLGSPQRLDPLDLAEQGEKIGLACMLQWLQQWIHDLVGLRLTAQARFQAEPKAETIRLANTVNLIELFKYQQELVAAQRTVQHPLNQRLLLEQLLLSYWQITNPQKAEHV